MTRCSIYLSKDNEEKLQRHFGGAGQINYTKAINTALAEWQPLPPSAPEEGTTNETAQTNHQRQTR